MDLCSECVVFLTQIWILLCKQWGIHIQIHLHGIPVHISRFRIFIKTEGKKTTESGRTKWTDDDFELSD